jgi:trans-2-enoyl-CoA reductase
VQQESEELWPTLTTENLWDTTDFAGYRSEFLCRFGFWAPGVDYERPAETDIPNSRPFDMTAGVLSTRWCFRVGLKG